MSKGLLFKVVVGGALTGASGIFVIFVDVVTCSRCPLWQKSDLAGMSLVSTAGSFYPTID